MSFVVNEWGQPIGLPVVGWTAARCPPPELLEGRYCRLEPLDAERHASDLYYAQTGGSAESGWTYLGYGPFADFNHYRTWLGGMQGRSDPLCYAIVDKRNGKACGVVSFLRIVPEQGVIEIGHVWFSPVLQHQTLATEALFLMLEQVFTLGFRRCEWKCDNLNLRSRRAAQRLGFSYEGLFRSDRVLKGRNRDTAWFSILKDEWSPLAAAFRTWLRPENFDDDGLQRQALSAMTRPLLKAMAPEASARVVASLP